jgi:phosphonatase-like hydrolase
MIELVVLDMSGTTIDDGDAVQNCFQATLAGGGVQVTAEQAKAVMGLPKPEAIRRLLAGAGRSLPESEVAAVHADFVRRMRQHYISGPAVIEVPGAAATFGLLRRAGIKVALNTGFSRPIADVLLQRLGWRVPQVIDAVVTSDEVPRGRPYPDMIQLLMERLGIRDARKVAKVGDTVVDLEEGSNAGCGLVIGVTTGNCTREQLQEHRHSHIVGSVRDIPLILKL